MKIYVEKFNGSYRAELSEIHASALVLARGVGDTEESAILAAESAYRCLLAKNAESHRRQNMDAESSQRRYHASTEHSVRMRKVASSDELAALAQVCGT